LKVSLLLSRFKKQKEKKRAALVLTAEGLAFAGLDFCARLPVLTDIGFAASAPGEETAKLTELVKSDRFRGHQISICLDPSRFSLSLVEAPAVDDEEKLQALCWKIKDLIDYPLEDLILDYADMPESKSGAEMVFAVASRRQAVQAIVDQVVQGDGDLQRIDIPAFALQNIISCLPEAQEGVALLNLTHHTSQLVIGRGKRLYLSRIIDSHSEDVRTEVPVPDLSPLMDSFESLLLEIQRSLDYYDSYFNDPPMRYLMVSACDHGFDELIAYLNQNLTIQVRRLALEQLIDSESHRQLAAEQYGEIILALGTALWDEQDAT
jgi:MSHA biogenesis protein MshI